jgi:hypothetical protein
MKTFDRHDHPLQTIGPVVWAVRFGELLLVLIIMCNA